MRFPLFQLAVVVAVILFLQAGDDNSARGQMFNGLDKLVESTVGLLSAVFNVKSFTKIMAHNRLLDCVCLPRLFADSVPSAGSNQ